MGTVWDCYNVTGGIESITEILLGLNTVWDPTVLECTCFSWADILSLMTEKGINKSNKTIQPKK